jgi:hypothetical protein
MFRAVQIHTPETTANALATSDHMFSGLMTATSDDTESTFLATETDGEGARMTAEPLLKDVRIYRQPPTIQGATESVVR